MSARRDLHDGTMKTAHILGLLGIIPFYLGLAKGVPILVLGGFGMLVYGLILSDEM